MSTTNDRIIGNNPTNLTLDELTLSDLLDWLDSNQPLIRTPPEEKVNNLDCGTSVWDFMQACDQQTNVTPTECWDSQGFSIYKNLVEEEFNEVMEAIANKDIKNLTQELVDLIVVSLGLAHTMGLPLQAMWDEVARANASKVDPVTGKVVKRADGKILKGPSFTPVSLERVFGEQS